MFLFRFVVVAALALVLAAPAFGAAVLTEGRLVDASGAATAGGSVELYLSSDVDADGEVTLRRVATATADSVGRFAASSSSLELERAAAENGGYVNLDVVVNSGGSVYYAAVVRRYVDGVWVDPDATSRGNILLQRVGSATLSPDAFCVVTKKLLSTERHRTAIGELHNAADVAYSALTYGRRADSDIGVGFSDNGTTWKVSGSVHVGNYSESAQTKTVKRDNWGHRLLTDFGYGKYRYLANCAAQTWYKIQARYWIPGWYVGQDNSQWDHHCLDWYKTHYSHFGPADAFRRATNDYARFVAAATMGFRTGGLDLTAQSGLSEWVDVFWKFGPKAHHFLCGNDAPVSTSHRIFAGA
jgi:hypothetical protein